MSRLFAQRPRIGPRTPTWLRFPGLLVAVALAALGCSPEPDESDAVCQALVGYEQDREFYHQQCDEDPDFCVLVACFGSAPDDVSPSCDRVTLHQLPFWSLDLYGLSCNDVYMTSADGCFPGWRRASFEPERAQCLTEAQRDEVFMMVWRESPRSRRAR